MGYNYKVMDAVTGLKRYYNDRRRADVVCDIKKRSRVERAKRHKIYFLRLQKAKGKLRFTTTRTHPTCRRYVGRHVGSHSYVGDESTYIYSTILGTVRKVKTHAATSCRLLADMSACRLVIADIRHDTFTFTSGHKETVRIHHPSVPYTSYFLTV